MKNVEQYKLYKGLQRPLIFKAFKGKYIYWALGSIVAGIVIGGIASSISSLIGLLTMAAVTTPLMMYTIAMQKKGLYHKKSDKTTFIISPDFKNYTITFLKSTEQDENF